jgi:excisionase family DNA binding protein
MRQIESPYLTSREALVYLRLRTLSALYSHIRENGLPVLRCGGDLRLDKRELDAWLRGTSSIELERERRKPRKDCDTSAHAEPR